MRVESLPQGCAIALESGGRFLHWAEDVETGAAVQMRRADGTPAMVGTDRLGYLTGWPDDTTLRGILQRLCTAQGIETRVHPDALRTRAAGPWRFWFNHGAEPLAWQGHDIPPAGVIRVRR